MLNELKIPFQKLAFAVDIETLAVWFILSMTGALVAVCLTLTSWNLLALKLWLVILQSIGNGIRDNFQLTNWRSRTVVSDASITTLTKNEHDMTVWNICIGKLGYRRYPGLMVSVNVREFCSDGDNFHHFAKRLVVVPDSVVNGYLLFWVLEELTPYMMDFIRPRTV